MTNSPQAAVQADIGSDEIAAHVDRYNPRVLSDAQRTTMLDEIRVAVLKAEPTTKYIAGNMLSVVCTFIGQSAPREGGRLADYLTEDQVASWISASVLKGVSKHTLASRRGMLARIVRASKGLPATISGVRARDVAAAPVEMELLARLRDACAAAGESALRGFVAVFGTGLRDSHCCGGIFVAGPDGTRLLLPSGAVVAVAPGVGDVADIVGNAVLDGDWRETRAIANKLGVFVDHQTIKQTHRVLAVLDPDPLAVLVARYHLTEDALNAIADYLPTLITRDETFVAAALRGESPRQNGYMARDVYLGPNKRTRAASARRANTRHVDGDARADGASLGGIAVGKKVSRAEVQRLAKQFREQAKTFPPIPDSVRDFIDNYEPIGIEAGCWERVAAIVRDEVKRAGFQSVAAVARHCTTFGLYMAWRDAQGLSLNVNDAMKLEGIDQFYLRGLTKYGDRTKNDYRSRLRTLASRVAPDVGAQVPSLGYNAVRQGYSSVEEAMIRRVSLGQPRRETRRRLCAVVGLSGGGGLDAQDLRWLLFDHIEVRDDGIHVDVHGPKARRVVIRRIYEPLVLAGIEGLSAGDAVVKLDRDKSNPAARVIADAQLFDDVPKIDVRRLRTTWITWLVTQRIPFDVILSASGLTSARTIVDMIATLPSTDPTGFLRDGGAS